MKNQLIFSGSYWFSIIYNIKTKIMTETLFKKLLETKPMQGIVLNLPELKDRTFIPNNYKLFTIWSLN